MRVLLRKSTTGADGTEEYIDSLLDNEKIRIGSAPECEIQILGQGIVAIHCTLELQNNAVKLQAEKKCAVLVNGKNIQQAILKPADTLKIGEQSFQCLAPTAGFDLILIWQPVAMEAHLLANAYKTSLDQLNFSVRRTAWLFSLAILLFAGILPLADYFLHQDNIINMGMANPQRLGFTHFWHSGTLLPAHQTALGDQCEACHQKAFVQVEDSACTQCHLHIPNHVAQDHPDIDLFADFACQDCHKEHNEYRNMVSESNKLCVNCHIDQDPMITAFAATSHPEFRLSLLQPEAEFFAGKLKVDWQKITLAAGVKAEENSYLKYPHDLHLDSSKITHTERGDALQCADCHTLQADEEFFAPINMEQHCASCHELGFDPNDSTKQLPHGSITGVYSTLAAYIIEQTFSKANEPQSSKRRLPGQTTTLTNCRGDYTCAEKQLAQAVEKEFTRNCGTCHELQAPDKATGITQWQVYPVRINNDWYHSAQFNHRSHMTRDNLDGDKICLNCHTATQSGQSTDILMPQMPECLTCHNDDDPDNRVPLNCIACHGYHTETVMPINISSEN